MTNYSKDVIKVHMEQLVRRDILPAPTVIAHPYLVMFSTV